MNDWLQQDDDPAEYRRVKERVANMLVQRGIDKADDVLMEFQNLEHLHAALGAIAWWDDQPKGPGGVTAGLLVHKLRTGGMPGYKPEGERVKDGGSFIVSPEMLDSLRRQLLSPDGVQHSDGLMLVASTAERTNLDPEQVIKMAVGPNWAYTPPHPASPWRAYWGDKPKEHPLVGRARYASFCDVENVDRPDPDVFQKRGESLWDYSRRFWGYVDPKMPTQKQMDEYDEALRRTAEAREQSQTAVSVVKQAAVPGDQTNDNTPAPDSANAPDLGEDRAPWPDEESAPW